MLTLKSIEELLDTKNAAIKKERETELATLKKELKEELTTSIESLLASTNEKIKKLEDSLTVKEQEITELRRDLELTKRKNNLVFFRVNEMEVNDKDLKGGVVNMIKAHAHPTFCEEEIDEVYRVGKKANGKTRPIVVSFLKHSTLNKILANKKELMAQNIGCSQDYPKSIIENRKKLQPVVNKFIGQGRRAQLRVDSIFVDGKKLTDAEVEYELNTIGKRLRSPQEIEQEKRLRSNIDQTTLTGARNKTPLEDNVFSFPTSKA